MRILILFIFSLIKSICFGQLNVSSGYGHSFIKIIDNENENLIDWNHSNRWRVGTEYGFKNNLAFSLGLNKEVFNQHSKTQESRTYSLEDCLHTETYFRGKTKTISLDLKFGYQWTINEKSSITSKIGVISFITTSHEISNGYKREEVFYNGCENVDYSQPDLVTETFHSNNPDYTTNQNFFDKIKNMYLAPIASVDYRYSLNKNFKPYISFGYTLVVGHNIRLGLGIIYTFKKNEK